MGGGGSGGGGGGGGGDRKCSNMPLKLIEYICMQAENTTLQPT